MSRTRTTRLAALLAALALSSPAAVLARNAAPSTPSFAGEWRLDTSRSDDPRKKFEEAMADAPRPGGPGGESRGGRPGGGPPPGGGRGRPDGERASGETRDGAAPQSADRIPESFVLEQTADTIAIVDRGLCVRRIVVSAQPVAARDERGIEQSRAQWKQDVLRVETRGPRGEKVIEAWKRIDEGHALRRTSTIVLPGSAGTVEVNRIYTLVRALEAPPAPATGGPQ